MAQRLSESATKQRASKSKSGKARNSATLPHESTNKPARRSAAVASVDAAADVEQWPGIDEVDAEQSVRERQHPSALADALSTDATDTVHPVERGAHPRAERHRSGTLADLADQERSRVHEPGTSIEPDEMGVQFLRDATEQGNFESSRPAGPEEHGEPAIEPLISEASLESADQQEVDWPVSSAFEHGPEGPAEGTGRELDVRADVMREVSLFDQGVDANEGDASRVEADAPPSGRTQTRTAALQTDDVAPPDETETPREREKRRMRRQLRRQRPGVDDVAPPSTR